ncbi:MAG: hypothetical protein OZSIB_2577 [Candidatus Ozemobacter sibiricus]|jgi:putative SOS response-associated peptidase YedK|uniref:Abasic site processing protein n=1 Tax=Candidatus Ozemobacter sibiricus TaxID=2268124 RepID=A0A367ZI78_9BACT|nr:MAG: hypothetical protein OZSIB_2577 [Candidatus Ozemobacter sibiricus]
MCGRFTLTASRRALLEAFRWVEEAPAPAPRYNICPTQPVLALVEDAQGRPQWRWLRWGLIPAWARDVGKGPPLINARCETVDRQPAFRGLLRHRRCLIPADGFYEWQAVPGRPKQPWYFRVRALSGTEPGTTPETDPATEPPTPEAKPPLPPSPQQAESRPPATQRRLFPEPPDEHRPAPEPGSRQPAEPTAGSTTAASTAGAPPGAVFALAGLWDTWLGPDGSELDSCVVLTTRPNELVEPIHHRMPVILATADHRRWLGRGDLPPAERERLFRPFPAAAMVAWKVGRGVGTPKRDDPRCIEPWLE